MKSLVLLAALVLPSAAFAAPLVRVMAPSVHVVTPGLAVHFDAWNPRAVPVYRPGFVWVGGHYDRYGYWVPGYYRPIETRAGMVYEQGYWSNGVYVEGYWRPQRVDRHHWIPGHYTPRRGWVPGHWSR